MYSVDIAEILPGVDLASYGARDLFLVYQGSHMVSLIDLTLDVPLSKLKLK